MAVRSPRYLVVIGLVLFASVVIGTPAKADDPPATKGLPVWCLTIQPEDNRPNDWMTLPEQSIHVVRASMQEKAKVVLAKASFVEMTTEDIRPYLRDEETVSSGKRIYLVRAAAFYVDDKYDLPKPAFRNLPFDVSYSPSRDMILVSNFALGYAGIVPSNLALVIESATPVAHTEAVCLRTQ